MDIVSDGTKRVLISFRLIFIASIILVFAVATSIKKPTKNPSTATEFGSIAFLSNLATFTPKSSTTEDAVAENPTDNPDVPITSSPENKDLEVEEKEKLESPKESDKKEERSSKKESHSVKNSNNPSSKTTSSATPANSSSSNSTSSSSNEIYVDDQGENIDNPAVFPIPYQETSPTTDGDTPEPAEPTEPADPEEPGEVIITPLPDVPSSQTEN